MTHTVPQHLQKTIFRAYDIRGVVGETITPDIIYWLGRAIGSAAQEQGDGRILVGRDGRLSGPILLEALQQGLCDSGCSIINIGQVPSPVLYFATHHLQIPAGVVLTASHNPADYNGLKIILGGKSLSEATITDLYTRIQRRDFRAGKGSLQTMDVNDAYIQRIGEDIQLARPLRIVLDCGNGIAGSIAPQLFRRLGCEVIELFCDVDGHFPNHHPDPSIPENLQDLIQAVRHHHADVGLALDGDGDRLGVVTNEGEIIWPDRQLMLYAMDVLSRNPGALIIYDVKSSRYLETVITEQGGRSLMWKTGHSIMKSKLEESGALLAGEMSGHVFFKERWYGFDDGLYTAARLLEILAQTTQTSSEVFATLPNGVSTPELKLAIAEEEKFSFMENLVKMNGFPEAEQVHTLDGLRVEYKEGWGLIRASNTSPYLILRFEAETHAALTRIQRRFAEVLLAIKPDFSLPFSV